MINVGYINNFPLSFGFGGKEIQMLAYEKHLQALYADSISILRLDYYNREFLDNVDILHLFGCTNSVFDLLTLLQNNPKRKKVVISPTLYYDHAVRVKIANSLANCLPLPNYFSYKDYIFNQADQLIVNSQSEKDQLIFIYGRQLNEKTAVIPNAIERDFNVFSSAANQNCFLECFNLQPGYLLSVSYMDERKNTYNLVRAFLQTHEQLKKKLVVIGGNRFKDQKKKRLVDQLLNENKDKIVHIPYLDRESDLLKSAYINCAAHLLPSQVETPGFSNLEALYFGKPILVARCRPVNEYFGDLAVYCQAGSIKSIAAGILNVLALANQPAFAVKAQRLIKETYILDKVMPKLYSLYQNLAQK